MVYAYDQWAQMPVKDLYDSQVMAMSIAAAKDMYEKGQKRLEDFNTKYGDFMSPIQKDMEWYDKNVTGKVRDTINNLYANGIDPLRSAEGRAAVAQLIYSMPTGDIAKVKQSAEDAKQYLKAKATLQSKGLWNPEYENMILGGKSLENWGTVEDGIWNRTSPAEYMDLNQYTSHIFDNVKDSYIGTDKNHYDWYGVTESDLHKSLTPDTLGGLLNSDLGKFHYNNAKNDLLRQGIANPTDAQIMQQFRNNIVAANHERVHQDRKINEMWKMQQENAARRAAARGSGGGGGYNSQNSQWSFMEQIRRNAITAITGQQSQEYGKNSTTSQRDAQIKKGLEISEKYKGNSLRSGAIKDFVNEYSKNEYNPSILAKFVTEGPGGMQRFEYGSKPGSIKLEKKDFKRLHSEADVVSHTTGFRNVAKTTNYNVFNKDGKEPDFVEVVFTGKSYGAFMKNARNENHFQAVVRAAYSNGTDAKGNPIYEYKNVDGNMYFDSHITSRQSDPKAGSLGKTNTDGSVTPYSKGMHVSNQHDSRFQDAIEGDKVVTDDAIKGTIFGSDAVLPEMSTWPSYN